MTECSLRESFAAVLPVDPLKDELGLLNRLIDEILLSKIRLI